MTSEELILVGSGLAAISGILTAIAGRRTNGGQVGACLLLVAGNLCSFVGVARYLASPVSTALRWPSPIDGVEFSLAVDGLSVVFLLPILIVSTLGSVYGISYWKQTDHPLNGRKLSFFFGTLTAAMCLLVLARDGVTFLFAWEVMAVSAFLLVSTDDQDEEVRRAGWLYLAASHVSTLCIFSLFALLRLAAGDFSLNALANSSVFGSGSPLANALFILALVGFGLKAGVMPLHVWLPSSHANAPSHVSGLLSGVLIKMGIYGLVRIGGLLPSPPWWWGTLLFALGVTSGVLGVVYAIGQHDIKRLLAYHSIENIGIIVMGLGLAMVGRSFARGDWVALGLGGALLHVWNHACFKSLLFLSAGSVVHATHTREIDDLGGLARRMPHSAFHFLVGAVAICGLPPLNGFVSELLVYLGMFRTLTRGVSESWLVAAWGIPALALIGGLAAACFAKVFGAVFLGTPRSHHSEDVCESGPLMIGPLWILSGICVVIGLLPWTVAPILDLGIAAWSVGDTSPGSLVHLAALKWVTVGGAILLGATSIGGCWIFWRLRTSPLGATVTWDCGYAAPSPTMQYTASSFAQMLVEFFQPALLPKTQTPTIQELFPTQARFESNVPDAVLDRVIIPVTHAVSWLLSWSRYFQQGNIHIYLLYVFATVVLLLML